jgi:hypothetical protein
LAQAKSKYRHQEWLLKYGQENMYEIYAQEPDPKKICLGTCNFTKDGQAFVIDKEKIVAKLSRARVSFIEADGIMISGFEKISRNKLKEPVFRYQEWWLRYV